MRRSPKILVLATAAVALVLLGMMLFYRRADALSLTSLKAEGHPIIGRTDAKIEIVVIEDFRCRACHAFIEEIFPILQREYIDTGIAYCVFVPIAISRESKVLANAALSVYQLSPLYFLPFIHALYAQFGKKESSEEEKKELILLAERLGGIDLVQFRKDVETDRFFPQLDQNFDWSKKLMGSDFGVPALYINGISTSTGSIDAAAHRINQLQRKGS